MNIHLKDGVEISDIQRVDPKLIIVLGWFVRFCKTHKLECTLTSIIAQKTPMSVSSTHPEGRAIDARTKSWTDEQITACMKYLEDHCGQLGAVTKEGTKRVCVYHDVGYGYHLHLQVFRENQ